MPDILEIKKQNSIERLGNLETRLAGVTELAEIRDLTIFVAGSYARQEASEHSDIDLFFILNGNLSNVENAKTRSLRAFAKIIEVTDALEFPAFSNDGEYLEILEQPTMKRELGGRNDDHLNYFTARMLMLLEGKPVYGKDTFEDIIKEIVAAYFRDYTHHPKDFRPVFLINDIIRFWKTLCLNYEHKRNQPEEDADRKLKQKVKNFKLKFSRMMTCFGSIVAIIGENGPPGPNEIIELGKIPPLQRLRQVVDGRSDLQLPFDQLCIEYNWFLEQTNVSGQELLDTFRSKEYREDAFERAERFGDAMFEITRTVAEETGYLRYLLI